MQRYRYDKAPYIEELVFRVKPELLEQYVSLNGSHWIPALSARKGFLGGELWVGEEGTGEVAVIYFWEHYEDFTGLDQEWLAGMKRKAGEAMGEGNVVFIGQMQASKKKYKLCECR